MIIERRYCKKCKCELAVTNKRRYCDNCRKKRIEKWQKAGKVAAGVAAAAATVAGGVLAVKGGKK